MKKILVILIVTASFLITGTVFAQVYPEGMISYWKFDEGNGTTANDSAGSSNGSIQGAVPRCYESVVGHIEPHL